MLGTISQLVHKLLTLLSSPWVGFLLKAFGGGAALIFGLLGLGANVRDVNGVLTDKGRLLRKGIIIGGALAIASVVYDFSVAQKSAQEEREKSQRLMLSVQRGIYPLRGMKVSFSLLFDKDFQGFQEYGKFLDSQILKHGCSDLNPRWQCDALGDQKDPDGYLIRMSSGLFPARTFALWAVLNNVTLKISAFQASSAHPTAGALPTGYTHLGFDFQVNTHDKLPSGTRLFYTRKPAQIRLEVSEISLDEWPGNTGGVYSLADFIPGMIAVTPFDDEDSLCEEAKIELEHCIKTIVTPLSEAMSIGTLELSFPYPKGVEIGEHGVPCEFKPFKYISAPLTEDIDTSFTFGDAKTEYSEQQKKLVCDAIYQTLPEQFKGQVKRSSP